jgi:lipid II:glycine glycyltransferase (peptidoglycan interpeptide bridge formation enzyme)
MNVSIATDRHEWDTFLTSQRFRPFLQSWTMGEVYKRVGQEPVRLIMKENDRVVGMCFAHVVPARRGKHLSIPYGPVLSNLEHLPALVAALKDHAAAHGCAFIRMSPFWADTENARYALSHVEAKESPLHLLAEHLWYLPLRTTDPWTQDGEGSPRSEEEIFKNLRSTARNLIRRAEKEGVTIEASKNPMQDLHHFLTLHEETRKRHGFTPYTNSFFRAQAEEFSKTGAMTLYLARYQNEVIAAAMHMHFGGETSYHHGASTHRFSKIPSSYLLQWTAIKDALKRGDRVYNFWGIAPVDAETLKPINKKHPFAGVTLFKTGFGGSLLPLTHCVDVPLTGRYYVTRIIESVRKWRRGF